MKKRIYFLYNQYIFYYNIISNGIELKINCKLLWIFLSYIFSLYTLVFNKHDICLTCFSYANDLRERSFILARGLFYRDIRQRDPLIMLSNVSHKRRVAEDWAGHNI